MIMESLGLRDRKGSQNQGVKDVVLKEAGTGPGVRDEWSQGLGALRAEAGPRPRSVKLRVRLVDKPLSVPCTPPQGFGLPLMMGCGGLPTSGASRCACWSAAGVILSRPCEPSCSPWLPFATTTPTPTSRW